VWDGCIRGVGCLGIIRGLGLHFQGVFLTLRFQREGHGKMQSHADGINYRIYHLPLSASPFDLGLLVLGPTGQLFYPISSSPKHGSSLPWGVPDVLEGT
jgi:hypothetical protein